MALLEDTGMDSLSLHDNKLFSDTKVEFSGKTFYGHKAILSQKSRYFKKIFTSESEEAHTGIIALGTDDEPAYMRNMLRHIYDLPLVTVYPPHEGAGSFVNLFLLADKYDVPSLRVLCETELKDNYPSCEEFMSTYFFGALQRCFSSEQADFSIKETLIRMIAPDLMILMKEPDFTEVLKKAPDLAVQLLSAIYARGGEFVSICWSCKHQQS